MARLEHPMRIDLSSFDLTPEWNKTAPGFTLPPKKNKPPQKPSAPQGDGIVRVGRETKGRKGAGVTVITGIPSHPEGLEKLAKQFKQQCGTGGTVKNGVIEIQGDHRDLLVKELSALGYTVKRAGG
jgi:translation initiation factor 1